MQWARCACDTHNIISYTVNSVDPANCGDGSGAKGVISGGDATEHICGVVGVIGVFGVATRLFASSPVLSSRERFGTRPYRTAAIITKITNI